MRSRNLRLDDETFGRLDVLKIDAAERRLHGGDHVDELVGIVFGELDVEHVDVGEFLEEAGLAFHHGLAGERADVAEAQHRGAVGDDRDEIAARGEVRACSGCA